MRLRFNIGQLLLLTALAALIIALLTNVYARARSIFQPEAVSFSPDGRAIATRFTDGTVNVWNHEGKKVSSFDTRDGWIMWSLGKQQIRLISVDRAITTNDSGQFDIWDVASGKRTGTFGSPNVQFGAETAAISGNGMIGATSMAAAATPSIEIWNLQTGQRIKRMPMRGGGSGMALSQDGSRLALRSGQGSVEVWDVETEELVAGPYSLGGDAFDVAYVFSNDLRAAASVDPSAFDPVDGQPIQLLAVESGQQATIATEQPVSGLQLSPDGRLLATWGPRNEVTFIDTQNGDTRGKITPPYKEPAIELPSLIANPSPPITFSPDGQEILVGSNMEVGIYDVATGKLKKRLWSSRQSLSAWFFAPAFITWAIFWGFARRRQRAAEAATRNEVSPVESITEEATAATVTSTGTTPPRSMIAVWVLLLIGGSVAIVWAIAIIFAQWTCLSLTPFPYYSLFAGVFMTSAAAGRRTDRLPLIYSVQMGNIICCDPVNFVLGAAGLILSRRPFAQRYIAAAK